MKLYPFISVIIPTFNRSRLLRGTIESLNTQTYDQRFYEIIVVDNNSSDNTRSVVDDCKKAMLVSLKYLFEPRQGAHYARNAALNIAQGEILYYTDDDMIADSNLLREIVRPFLFCNKIASVTGKVLPKWEKNPPKWIIDYCVNSLLSLNDRPEELIITPYDCGVISCHQALRRDAFVQSGGFNPDNTAGEWIGDGETGLNIKLAQLGWWFAYIGSSVTFHVIPPERMTQAYLNGRLANQGNCDSYTDYRRNKYGKFNLVGSIVRHIKSMVIQWLKFLIKRFSYNDSWRLNRARVEYYRNRIGYDGRLLFDEDRRNMATKYDWLNEPRDTA